MVKTKDIRLLIAEDDEEMCEELSEILQGQGYSVDTINSGFEAERLINQDNYDVVLLDLKLPGIKGYEVLRHIRKNQLKVKVVVLTGNPVITAIENLENKKKAKSVSNSEVGKADTLELADAVIPKPFDVEKVIATLEKLTQKTS